GEDRAGQEIRPATAEPVPGAVGVVADDRLHDQPGERCDHPQDRDVVHLGAERLEDPADVGVLPCEAELDAQEAETHVPDLPERQFGFPAHGVRVPSASGAMYRSSTSAWFNGPSMPPVPPV